jgi:hypothetical protein
MTIAVAFILLTANPPSARELANFIAGIEGTPYLVNGKPIARVEKEAGEVVWLRLDGMQLAPDDFRLLASLPTLRRLSLARTNVTDKDLAHLRSLTRLEGIVLNQTEVTDRAIDELVHVESLRSACLGQVRITPAAVGRLKEQFPKLSLGYCPRP